MGLDHIPVKYCDFKQRDYNMGRTEMQHPMSPVCVFFRTQHLRTRVPSLHKDLFASISPGEMLRQTYSARRIKHHLCQDKAAQGAADVGLPGNSRRKVDRKVDQDRYQNASDISAICPDQKGV